MSSMGPRPVYLAPHGPMLQSIHHSTADRVLALFGSGGTDFRRLLQPQATP